MLLFVSHFLLELSYLKACLLFLASLSKFAVSSSHASRLRFKIFEPMAVQLQQLVTQIEQLRSSNQEDEVHNVEVPTVAELRELWTQ